MVGSRLGRRGRPRRGPDRSARGPDGSRPGPTGKAGAVSSQARILGLREAEFDRRVRTYWTRRAHAGTRSSATASRRSAGMPSRWKTSGLSGLRLSRASWCRARPSCALTRWCVARGAGAGRRAGRVRAPAGRLRLLRQIGDELVPGVEQVLLVDDVVAVEDGADLVPCQKHGDPLGHAGAGRPGSGAQRLASCGPVTIRATTPNNVAIGPWRLALLCLLAPGPGFLHPDAGCLLGGVRHLPPLTN